MRTQFVMGNWKMHGSRQSVDALLQGILIDFPMPSRCVSVVFPPAIYMPAVQAKLADTPIAWGSQNIHPEPMGAYTGEHACAMFAEFGCRYVLVGHSERRQLFNERVEWVAEKFHQVQEHGMIPVLCIGETLAEREAGRTNEVLAAQLCTVKLNFTDCVIAYEPVWAIGTGHTATPDVVQSTHAFIREVVTDESSANAEKLSIVYGGSVNAANARALLSMPDVDGALVGGASLRADTFLEIIKCIN